ncbi:expressed protein [Echinococcus multilocularis]|uniref:Expressed protein n=1 Tax=Echinococcus multilocularis TaxID=6211 RepID=A0A068XZF5_ECHMU|nr:expressed protein [Echinococcus multilocularis]
MELHLLFDGYGECIQATFKGDQGRLLSHVSVGFSPEGHTQTNAHHRTVRALESSLVAFPLRIIALESCW